MSNLNKKQEKIERNHTNTSKAENISKNSTTENSVSSPYEISSNIGKEDTKASQPSIITSFGEIAIMRHKVRELVEYIHDPEIVNNHKEIDLCLKNFQLLESRFQNALKKKENEIRTLDSMIEKLCDVKTKQEKLEKDLKMKLKKILKQKKQLLICPAYIIQIFLLMKKIW